MVTLSHQSQSDGVITILVMRLGRTVIRQEYRQTLDRVRVRTEIGQ